MRSIAALLFTLQLVVASSLIRPTTETQSTIAYRDEHNEKRTGCLLSSFLGGQGCPSGSYCHPLFGCQTCAGGFFLFSSSSTSCSACPAGSYSPLNSLSSILAPLGHFCPGEGNSAPTPAPSGYFCGSTGLSLPTIAPLGFFCSGTGNTAPTPAPAGHYCGSTGLSLPTPAPKGSYCSGTGSTKPILAPEGHYCDNTGMTAPIKAPAGSLCLGTGNILPNFAPEGSFLSLGSLSFTLAPRGSYCPGKGNTAPVLAPKGTYCPESGLGNFLSCLEGSYSDILGAISCKTCPLGFFCPPKCESPQPIVCGDGTQLVGSTCTACNAGEYSKGGAACQKCPLGSFSSAAKSSSCTPCSAGTTTTTLGSTSCSPITCGDGFQLSGSTCTACNAGEYSKGGATCQKCPLGTFSSASKSSSCTPCSTGTTTTMIGSTSCSNIVCNPGNAIAGDGICRPCASGSYSDGKMACTNCPVGKFSGPGAASCTACPINTFAMSTGTPDACPACPSGTNTLTTGSIKCDNVICLAGTQLVGSTCTPCPAGQSSLLGGKCTPCIAGTFASGTGNAICSICPTNKISVIGASTCDLCTFPLIHNLLHTACVPTASGVIATPRKRSMVCQGGLTACAIGTGLKTRAFECVDTQSDIQSCGGCWSTGAGVDCTAFDDRATATCVQGQCQYKCPLGWKLTSTGCVKASEEKGNSTVKGSLWNVQSFKA